MTLWHNGVRPVVEGTLEGDTWTTTARNVWEGDTCYSPLVLRLLPSGGYNYLSDGLGSTRQLMRHSDHAITDTYTYDAFGNTLSATGSTDNPYRYVGALGYRAGGDLLYHLGARHARAYLSSMGRFFQRDAFQWKYSLLNPYAYAESRPTVWRDPNGALIPGAVGCGLGAAGGIIGGVIGGSGFWGTACRAAADCLIGWASEIVVEGSGGALAACVFGMAGAAASMAADQLCSPPKTACPKESRTEKICTGVDLAVGSLLGCVGGLQIFEKVRRKIDDLVDIALQQFLGIACRH